MNHIVRSVGSLVGISFFLGLIQIEAASIRVTQEFIYPSGFEPPQVVAAGGGVGGDAAVGITPSIPTDFRTREVGVILNVPVVSVTGPGDGASAYGIHLTKSKQQTGNSDLMIAAATGDLQQVKTLLAQGAPVNAQNKHGSTALMGAAAGGFVPVVKALLEAKASVDLQTTNGSNALMYAARNGHEEVVDLLLESKINVDLVDRAGNSALMYAINGGHTNVVQSLVDAGATVNYRTRQGLTPLQYAANQGQQEIVVLLTRSGAK